MHSTHSLMEVETTRTEAETTIINNKMLLKRTRMKRPLTRKQMKTKQPSKMSMQRPMKTKTKDASWDNTSRSNVVHAKRFSALTIWTTKKKMVATWKRINQTTM